MNRIRESLWSAAFIVASFALTQTALEPANGQELEELVKARPVAELVRLSVLQGDPEVGAAIFHRPEMACSTCHSHHRLGTNGPDSAPLGPDLAALVPSPSDEELIESILEPSRKIRKGFGTITITTIDGRVLRGMLIEQSNSSVRIREAAGTFPEIEIPESEIETLTPSPVSLMPAGLINALRDPDEFIHLVAYLRAIRDGGPQRAGALYQSIANQSLFPVPDYEASIDHAGFIRDLDNAALERGKKIYGRICANCHGTHDQEGSLPTSLRFSSGKFKNGSDPYSIYRTLTHGYGLMVPQTWMVPQQKYDVVHYIREKYLKDRNSSQYTEITDLYLRSLPPGTLRGPAPTTSQPWEEMNYGPNLIATYEVGDDGRNFAYKGNAIRLDPGPGGVSRGSTWVLFDLDTLRVAALWNGDQFIDYRGINFDGAHGIHPRIVGKVGLENPTGPGWGRPGVSSTSPDAWIDTRITGRDGRQYGPLPRSWAQYRGMYYHGDTTILSYTVGDTEILESHTLPTFGTRAPTQNMALARHLEIGPRSQPLILQVAHTRDQTRELTPLNLPATKSPNEIFLPHLWGNLTTASSETSHEGKIEFAGKAFLQIDDATALNMDTADYTLFVRFKTDKDGTLFCTTLDQPKWVPNGKSLFIRSGRLTFDIGWVGAVSSNQRVDDNRWHDVAITYRAEDSLIRFFIDGQSAGEGHLKPQPTALQKPVARIGMTAENFPTNSIFHGEIARVAFFQKCFTPESIPTFRPKSSENNTGLPDTQERLRLIADWDLENASTNTIESSGSKASGPRSLIARVARSPGTSALDNDMDTPILVALTSSREFASDRFRWDNDGKNLRLVIPEGEDKIRFSLIQAPLLNPGADQLRAVNKTSTETLEIASQMLADLRVAPPAQDLALLTQGGPPRWPETIQTKVIHGNEQGPFAVDQLSHPQTNPWLCRMRLTGHDFFADGDRAAVCDWDGNVWLVQGISNVGTATKPATLTWKRIASGLFQPLGLKIIDNKIHVTCRDQLCRLHDLNNDEAIDWIECLNNDHQVTEHFHEFAMGLQVDETGNFYYAKSARHALKAVVPHHGTLLRISPDGRKTEILATGFRAANGVCINPDGTFFVTDQEGHWNPKNRINWVRTGGFYGNMFGYHDVVDPSDQAMESPVCWITNAFDRSPAELLWVDSPNWDEMNGALLSLSYGYGKVFLVLPEKVGDSMQGGMIELPIPQFPTGIIRGRFHPHDGHLYLSGMYSWAGNQQQPGGFYRLRKTQKPLDLPLEMRAQTKSMTLRFPHALDPRSLTPENCHIKIWDLKRSANYGSPHLNERTLRVTKIQMDGTLVTLQIPELTPTSGMEIQYDFLSVEGRRVSGTIHNTIHPLPTETP